MNYVKSSLYSIYYNIVDYISQSCSAPHKVNFIIYGGQPFEKKPNLLLEIIGDLMFMISSRCSSLMIYIP